MTHNPEFKEFKGTPLFHIEYLGKDTRYGHSYCGKSIGTETGA